MVWPSMPAGRDRKSTRLNSSHDQISYAVFCLNKNTIALVRFPPTATKEIQYLNAKGALTYTDIAGDPVLYGNLPPREISMKDVFRSGDSSKKFKIAEGQWYRYAPSYVSPAYHLLEGFPFIQELFFLMIQRPPISTLFPYATLFRS